MRQVGSENTSNHDASSGLKAEFDNLLVSFDTFREELQVPERCKFDGNLICIISVYSEFLFLFYSCMEIWKYGIE